MQVQRDSCRTVLKCNSLLFDAIATGGILLHHGVAPQATHDAVERHLLFGREGSQLGVGEAFHQLQRLHDRTMTFVVGPELEGRQEFGHHAPVVPLVRIADHGAQRRAVGWPSGFPLLDQIAQGLLANHRKDDLAHHAVRLSQCGIGQFEQQVLLAADALDVIEQFTFDLAFGARAPNGTW